MEMERTQKKGLMRGKVGEGVLEDLSACVVHFDCGYKRKNAQMRRLFCVMRLSQDAVKTNTHSEPFYLTSNMRLFYSFRLCAKIDLNALVNI